MTAPIAYTSNIRFKTGCIGGRIYASGSWLSASTRLLFWPANSHIKFVFVSHMQELGAQVRGSLNMGNVEAEQCAICMEHDMEAAMHDCSHEVGSCRQPPSASHPFLHQAKRQPVTGHGAINDHRFCKAFQKSICEHVHSSRRAGSQRPIAGYLMRSQVYV